MFLSFVNRIEEAPEETPAEENAETPAAADPDVPAEDVPAEGETADEVPNEEAPGETVPDAAEDKEAVEPPPPSEAGIENEAEPPIELPSNGRPLYPYLAQEASTLAQVMEEGIFGSFGSL